MNPETISQPPKAAPRKINSWAALAAFLVLFGFLTVIYWALTSSHKGPLAVGEPAPDFTLTTFDGKIYNTADWRGKVVVVNFWASWCPTCKDEAVDLENAWKHYREGGEVLFLGVDYVDTEPEALAYLEKYGITYPNGQDARTSISRKYRMRAVPETYIIDRQGRLAYIKIGPFLSLEEILAAIDEALAR